jgi:hypothetical protein
MLYTMTKRNDPEHQEQKAFFEFAALHFKKHPELELIYAIPNGGHRHKAVAAKMKAEGVKDGVPDMCLPVARGPYHALYIEMKAPYKKNHKLPTNQQWWKIRLTGEGNGHSVCYDWEDAWDTVMAYLAMDRTNAERSNHGNYMHKL